MSSEATVTEHSAHDTHEHAHPGPGEYIKIAVILAIITTAEVGAYYLTGIPRPLFSLMLIVMMVLKFSLVGLWFMHLRFDSLIFRRLFVGGIILATLVYFVAFSTLGLQHSSVHNFLHWLHGFFGG